MFRAVANEKTERILTHNLLRESHSVFIAPDGLVLFQSVERKAPNPWRVNGKVPDDNVLIKAPLNQSGLEVVGILSGKDCATSIVIIKEDNSQKSYRCGETLSGRSVVIVKIFHDVVIINNKNYYETLRIDQ
ncbi:hypothetical protein EB241_16735 [Erwinia psidii]|uniref:Type II secretion system protein GspC N-terminal domain-containing protein n=2 Tax=Erwinia psidii TaxID=69224 RepID=A0A3N6RXF5_9GAMM|nr:hypothetical protein EB241_16735 [Erwinia psidii]